MEAMSILFFLLAEQTYSKSNYKTSIAYSHQRFAPFRPLLTKWRNILSILWKTVDDLEMSIIIQGAIATSATSPIESTL